MPYNLCRFPNSVINPIAESTNTIGMIGTRYRTLPTKTMCSKVTVVTGASSVNQHCQFLRTVQNPIAAQSKAAVIQIALTTAGAP
jgi:hypothetical protein